LTEAWYALTLEGTWGSSPSTHIDNRIYLGQNAVLFTPKEQTDDEGPIDENSTPEDINLPEFALTFENENRTLRNGDWVIIGSDDNESYTLQFTHSQPDSTIRWTNALNSNPFWSSATKSEDSYSITVEEPVNLIHIESTNLNGEIHIVRIGIDWPNEDVIESENPNQEEELMENKQTSSKESVSLPLLMIVGVIAAYLLIILSLKGKDELLVNTEEE